LGGSYDFGSGCSNELSNNKSLIIFRDILSSQINVVSSLKIVEVVVVSSLMTEILSALRTYVL